MECAKLTEWHVCCKIINKFSRLDLDGRYTGNIYPLYVILSSQFYSKMGALYWSHGNTPFDDKIKYNIQC